MKNNKGQALVEFVIVLPILLLLIISIIDFGNIIIKKTSLENDIDVISDLYKEEKNDKITEYINSKDLTIDYSTNEDLLNIKISKDIKITSPLLIVVFGKNYEISTEKSIYVE